MFDSALGQNQGKFGAVGERVDAWIHQRSQNRAFPISSRFGIGRDGSMLTQIVSS
jgi:hypothetical protein